MDFEIPQDVQTLLKDLDDFIEAEIKPLQGVPRIGVPEGDQGGALD